MAIPETFTGFLVWGLSWLLAGFFFATGMSLSKRLVG